MIIKLIRTFFSIETAIIILLVFAVAQIYATLGFSNDDSAWRYVYGSRWFESIMWLLGINLAGVLLRFKTYKKLPIFTVHVAIIVILLGSFVTRYFGYGGVLHLRVHDTSSEFFVQDKTGRHKGYSKDMGFSIRLDKFVVKKYAGSTQPSSYDSYVTITDKSKSFPYHIYMNHILKYKGLRIYQMSYDRDELGSILYVNYDPGILITYFGYLLLTIGFLLSMFYKKGRLVSTVNILKSTSMVLIFTALFVFVSFSTNAMSTKQWSEISKHYSKIWRDVLIQFHGRIEPMDTFDMDVVYKISKTTNIDGMNYNQIVMGMIVYPEMFQAFDMIYVGNSKLQRKLNIKGKYASYNDFFSKDEQFKFKKELYTAIRKPPSQRNEFDRELLKVNERVYVAYTVYTAKAFKLFPIENGSLHNFKWYSFDDFRYINEKKADQYFTIFKNLVFGIKNNDIALSEKAKEQIYDIQKRCSLGILPDRKKIKLEIFYNHAAVFPMLIGIYILIGIIVIFFGFIEILKDAVFKKAELLFVVIGWIVLILHTANMILRWYISGHLPWSDAYESIIFIAWSSAFVSLVFFRKFMLALGAGFFVSGMFMMVAHLNSIDPQITNMVPVLKSYWLLIHVAVITIGYGFLAVSFMLGLINMILFIPKHRPEDKIEQINKINYIAVYAGLIFLTIGTFLGGVWANESWGKYWSWDPKETWSLISIIAYAVLIHLGMIKQKTGEFIFSLLSFLSFFFILMTYFGVNFYIAQGLHSYGRGTAGYEWFYLLKAGVFLWFVVVGYTLFTNTNNKKINL